MEKLKRTIVQFEQKYNHILWIGVILLFLFFAAVYVYLNAVCPSSMEPHRVMDSYSLDTDLLALQLGSFIL